MSSINLNWGLFLHLPPLVPFWMFSHVTDTSVGDPVLIISFCHCLPLVCRSVFGKQLLDARTGVATVNWCHQTTDPWWTSQIDLVHVLQLFDILNRGKLDFFVVNRLSRQFGRAKQVLLGRSCRSVLHQRASKWKVLRWIICNRMNVLLEIVLLW